MTTFKTLNLQYLWDQETYIQGSEFSYHYEFKKSARKYIGYILIALFQLAVVASLKKGSFTLLFFSTFLLAYWYYFRWPLRKRMILKKFNQSHFANQIIEIKLNENQIDLNGNPITWDELQGIVISKKGYLVYYQQDFIFIPKNAFKENQDEENFSKLINLKLEKEKIHHFE